MSNGDMMLAGSSGPAGSETMWIQKISAQGNVLWSKTFADNTFAIARDIQKTADGNFSYL